MLSKVLRTSSTLIDGRHASKMALKARNPGIWGGGPSLGPSWSWETAPWNCSEAIFWGYSTRQIAGLIVYMGNVG